MANMQEFIATFLGAAQEQRARRAQQVAETTAKAQQIAAVQTILSQVTNPKDQDRLIEFFGPQLGKDGTDVLRQISTATNASAATTRDKIVADNAGNLPEGAGQDITLAVLGGGNRAQVAESGLTADAINSTGVDPTWARAFVLNKLTGQTEGGFNFDQAMANVPGVELMQAAKQKLGLLLSPAEQEQFAQGRIGLNLQQQSINNSKDLGWAGNRLGWANLLNSSVMSEAELGIRQQAAAAKAAADGDDETIKLLSEITSIEKVIQQGNMNREAVARNLMIMKDHYRRLVQKGHTQFAPLANMDVAKAADNTYVPGGVWKQFWGSRGSGNTFDDVTQLLQQK